MALKRPDRLKYAIYTKEGKEKYAKDMRAYKAAQKKEADKKAETKSKTNTKTQTKTKTPTRTKTKTKTQTKSKTPTRTQTKSKTQTKTTPKTESTTKTTPKSKTASNTTNKQPTKQPAKRGRPAGSKNKPRVRKQIGNLVKKLGKGAKDLTIKGYKKGKGLIKKGVQAYKNTPQNELKKPETKGQRAASGLKNLAKRTIDFQLENARQAKANIKNPKNIKSNVGGSALALGAGIAEQRLKRLTDRAFKGDKTLSQYRKDKDAAIKKDNKATNLKIRKGVKNFVGNTINKVRGKGNNNQSSTTKNINKQKKDNNQTVKKQKTNVNPQVDKLKIAKQRVKKAKGYNKGKLQREVRYLEKFGKQGRTWSNPVGAEGKGKPSTVKTETPKKKKESKFIKTSKGTLARRGSVSARRAENRERARKRAQEMARQRLANK